MISEANSEQLATASNGSFQAEKKSGTCSRATIFQYLTDLREEYQNIRAGMYCRNWMIDAVLYTQIGMAKEQGIAVDCQVQNFSCDTVSQEKLARLLFELLDFGIRENDSQGAGSEPIHAHTDTEYSASNSDCIQDGGGRTAAKSQTMGSANRKGIWCRD